MSWSWLPSCILPLPAGPGGKMLLFQMLFLGHAVASGQVVAWFLPSSRPAPNHWRTTRETPLPPAASLLWGWTSFGEVAS